MPLAMGVDSSTQSTKVEIRDVDTGELIGSGRAPHPPTSPPRSEQEPQAWREALLDARTDAGSHGVQSMAIAAQQHGLVVLDEAREVIRPAKLWNDTESSADADWLVEQLGGRDAWARACGSVPAASFTITKLSWLHRKEPDHFGRIRHVLLPHDWLTFHLSGRFVTDRGDASGTGYWSPAEGKWRLDLLGIVDGEKDWERCLPEVVGPTEPVRRSGGTVVAPGTGDNMAAALGLALEPGRVAGSLGTSGTVFTVARDPVTDPSGNVCGFADATGRFLPLVCSLNAMKVPIAMARMLRVDLNQFDQLALEGPPGAGGVVLIPYFDGERTPNRPDASGTLRGLRSDTTAAMVARATVEGVVCGLLAGLDALRAVGVPVDDEEILLIGGGARAHAFQRVFADLSGLPVRVPRGEHVAAGACVQAAATLTEQSPEEVAAAWSVGRQGHVIEPDPAVDGAEVRAAYARSRDIAGRT